MDLISLNQPTTLQERGEEKLLSMGTKAARLGPRGASLARIFGEITGITSSARGKNNPGNRLQLQLVTAGCATAD